MSPVTASSISKPPITEQIQELQKKLSLLEGDRKAYYESSQWTMKKNREQIQRLRKETRDLRNSLHQCMIGDEDVLDKAFDGHQVERAAFRAKPCEDVRNSMDYKVSDNNKKINAIRHQRAEKIKKLELLQTQYDAMVREAAEALATDAGESFDAQALRQLENRLDKAEMKTEEAIHINLQYTQITEILKEDALHYNNNLGALEQEIQNQRKELQDLRMMCNDAHVSRDAAKEELQKQEELIVQQRKELESSLQEKKKAAEERKMHAERVEKRMIQRASSIPGEDFTPPGRGEISNEEQQQQILTYEDGFRKIKEATGVSNIQEVVDRFESQDETKRHLMELQSSHEDHIKGLQTKKTDLQHQFETMKYSGEEAIREGTRVLDGLRTKLEDGQTEKVNNEDKLDRSTALITKVRAGVEHLYDKLTNLPEREPKELDAALPRYPIELLGKAEEKLVDLLENLDRSCDLEEVTRNMEEEEFHHNIEGKVPAYNTRVTLPTTTSRDNVYEEEEESGDDDDVLTRHQIKHQSQQMVDSRTKRKQKRKKKTK